MPSPEPQRKAPLSSAGPLSMLALNAALFPLLEGVLRWSDPGGIPPRPPVSLGATLLLPRAFDRGGGVGLIVWVPLRDSLGYSQVGPAREPGWCQDWGEG